MKKKSGGEEMKNKIVGESATRQVERTRASVAYSLINRRFSIVGESSPVFSGWGENHKTHILQLWGRNAIGIEISPAYAEIIKKGSTRKWKSSISGREYNEAIQILSFLPKRADQEKKKEPGLCMRPVP